MRIDPKTFVLDANDRTLICKALKAELKATIKLRGRCVEKSDKWHQHNIQIGYIEDMLSNFCQRIEVAS